MKVYDLIFGDLGEVAFFVNRELGWRKDEDGTEFLDVGVQGDITSDGIFLGCEFVFMTDKPHREIERDIREAEKSVKGLYSCPELGVEKGSFTDVLRAFRDYLASGDRKIVSPSEFFSKVKIPA